jgi:hypothetical protein
MLVSKYVSLINLDANQGCWDRITLSTVGTATVRVPRLQERTGSMYSNFFNRDQYLNNLPTVHTRINTYCNTFPDKD